MRVGMELEQAANFPATLTQADFAKNLQPLGTSPELRAARQKLLSPEDVKLRQCKLGEPCWLATVPRPDICARLARIAPRVNSLQGADVYRANDLVNTVKMWQPATVLKYFSSCKQDQGSLAPRIWDERHRKETIRGNAMTLVGWSDAAHGDQSSMGKCCGCYRPHVAQLMWTMSSDPMDVKVHSQIGERQPWGRGLRLQRNVGSHVHAS